MSSLKNVTLSIKEEASARQPHTGKKNIRADSNNDVGKEYKSFYKEVGGNEGTKCNYSTRLDTYGCGCAHDCKYCYAKSLLNFRGLWDPKDPSVADIEKIKRKISKIPKGSIIRLGGMTDCFQPCERKHRVTLQTIRAMNDAGVGYLIVTKSAMVAEAEYIGSMDRDLAHIQVTVTTTDPSLSASYEKASLPKDRIAAIEKLYDGGFDIALRLSPYIPEFVDLDELSKVRCDKILIEFLRVNSWIKKWFDIDYSEYTLKQSGYCHLPLEKKIEYVGRIKGFEQVTVCDDEDGAYEYWKHNFNPNSEDCCNLRI